jgi:small-conductance mechanosensitive channel
LNIVRAVIVLSVLLWLTGQLRGFLERRIYQAQNLTPSLQALLVQLLKLLLPLIAVLVALPLVGLNLTAVTVFGGAFAVGAGLGLQRAVANLVSGFMLLGSKSIRPGDVIAVKDMGGAKTYGRVNSIGALYVSLRTRDGIDYLVPNDSFLSTGIENWTHADNNVRVKLPFGVAHGSDLKQVIAAALDAAASVPRVLKSPQPVCFLTGYSDSALNFELRFWINDPMNGLSNVRGECLLSILERLRSEAIRMPFPPAPG